MYNISFKPPLGETVEIVSSSLSPDDQPAIILFSAHLSQANYEKLVQDGGRVQLWSDMPRAGKVNNGAWGKMDFENSRPVYPIELRRVSLKANTKDEKNVILSLLVSLPPTATAKNRRFSFTYRILYASGGITWLGQFGKNGTVNVTRAQPNSLSGLVLSQGWSVNRAENTRIFEVKSDTVDAVEVAKLNKRSCFGIYALGKDSLNTNLRSARAICLAPLPQEHSHNVLPTYALYTSAGLTASVSDQGLVTLSGSGTATLRSSESASETFIERVLQDSQLTNWKVLASDLKSNTFALASIGSSDSIDVIALARRTSRHSISSLRLSRSQLIGTFGDSEIDGFDLSSHPSGEQVHRFDNRSEENQDIVLEFDGNSGHFIIKPLYNPDRKTPETFLEEDKNAVESRLAEEVTSTIPSTSADADVLPTPPISPKLTPVDHHASSASIDTLVASISSLPVVEDTTTKPIFTFEVPHSKAVAHEKEVPGSLALEKVNPPPRPNTMSIFQTVFASIRIFLRAFFRIFLCPIIPFSQGRLRRLPAPGPETDTDQQDSAIKKNAPALGDSLRNSDLDDDSDGEVTVTLEKTEQSEATTSATAVV